MEQVYDEIVGDYISKSGYLNDITKVLPEGSEIFIGLTLKIEDGEFKQKSLFGKIQNMGKAKPRAKFTPKQGVKMSEDKKLASEFKQIKIGEDDF